MALIARLYVNNIQIGYVAAVRKEGGRGNVCKYRIEGATRDVNGDVYELRREEDLHLYHHYDDGAAILMSKALELFDRRKTLADLAAMSEEDGI